AEFIYIAFDPEADRRALAVGNAAEGACISGQTACEARRVVARLCGRRPGDVVAILHVLMARIVEQVAASTRRGCAGSVGGGGERQKKEEGREKINSRHRARA